MELNTGGSVELEIKIVRDWRAYLKIEINGETCGDFLDAFQAQEKLAEVIYNFYKYGQVEDEQLEE